LALVNHPKSLAQLFGKIVTFDPSAHDENILTISGNKVMFGNENAEIESI